MSIASSKGCELADFRDPELRGWIRDVFAHELGRFGDRFPAGLEYRKHWEIGMTAMALARAGLLHAQAEVLGVGAGNEPTLFWLTRHVRRVFATDLYLGNDGWEESAARSMLEDPAQHWPFDWRAERLVVQHMDARRLRYEPESFDAIFSSSSLEHFGDEADVRQAIGEMHRVLRPGGLLCISTELRLDGPAPGLPGILMFDRGQLDDLFLSSGEWEPLDGLDLQISSETLDSAVSFEQAAADVRAHVAREGRLRFDRLEWSTYPQLVLRHGALRWTSVHCALRRVQA